MNTKALRQKVLDLAIHGKLVPQNPNDESAKVLLEKIRAEKAEKIKKGELKADKKDSFIFVGSDKRHYEQFADGTVKDIEDEIPFDVPEGWAWCRFSEASINRDSERKPVNSSNRKNVKKIYDYYGAAGVIDKVEEYLFDEKLLLIGEDGANLLSRTKNNAFIACGKYWVNNHAHVIDCFDKSMLDYLCYYINAITLDEYITGSAQPKFTQKALNDLLLPLPALKEQQRIINTIERFFAKIDELELNKTDIQTAIKQAKSKILDLAIHGKLVPQDPNDEPAEELLKRIATSDNRPYEKVEDEVDYEIPKNWSLSKIKDVCSVIMGQSPKGEAVSDDINGMEFHQGKICFGEKYLEKSSSFTAHITKIAPKDSVLLCVRAPVGIVNITQREICIGRGLCAVNPKYDINSDFWFYWLKSLQADFEQKATGTTFRAISVDVIKNQILPIPPVKEQKWIVNKIDELYSLLDQIQNNLI